MDEIIKQIKQFEKLLSQRTDNSANTFEFLSFFRKLVRVKSNTPIPTIELGTILKHEKPLIFQDFKKLSENDRLVDFITNVNMDYQEAINRVNSFKIKNLD
ncbi:hypothetical protein ACNQFZ_08160 [Schinkia sp. CFF1]